MVDILKITSPVIPKNKVENLPKNLPKDVVFDITGAEPAEKKPAKAIDGEEDKNRQLFLKDLNRQMLEPLLKGTNSTAEALQKLIRTLSQAEGAQATGTSRIWQGLFIQPEKFLDQLTKQDQNQTVFKGAIFDSLRVLAKVPDQPALKEALGNFLKIFDCFVKQEASALAVETEVRNLLNLLPKKSRENLESQLQTMKIFPLTQKAPSENLPVLLKSELIPLLTQTVRTHKGEAPIYDKVMSVIHYIVRMDQGQPPVLEEAILRLGEEISRLTNLSSDEMQEMKQVILKEGSERRLEMAGALLTPEEAREEELPDIPRILTIALEKTEGGKSANPATNLLLYLLQSESPSLPQLNFTIPIQWMEQNTYVEFFIDKEVAGRKGNAQQARNILFTVSGEHFGPVQVDLLAKDQFIEITMEAPEDLAPLLSSHKREIGQMIQEEGYRLSSYQVGIYKEEKTIWERFPEVRKRRVGIDVKI